MASSPETFDPYFHWLGIDPTDRPVNHYTLLGLPLFEADPARIAAAADERMRLIRQYQAGPRGIHTQKLLNELARAKICLLNPVSKPAYDQALHQLLYPPPVTPANAAEPPPPRRRLEDIMPPGWDGSSVAPPETIPPLPLPAPRPMYVDGEEPADSSAPPLPRRELTTTLWLGGLIVVAGILGVFVTVRLVAPRSVARTEEPPLVSIPEEPEAEAKGTPEPQPPATPMPTLPDEPATAIVVLQEGSGEVNLTPATALVEGKLERDLLGTSEVLVRWSSPADVAEWQFKLVKPGFFELELQYVSHPSLAGRTAKVTWGDKNTKEITLREPGGEGAILRESHIILIKRGGLNTLTIRPTGPWPEDAFRLVSIRLIPAVGP